MNIRDRIKDLRRVKASDLRPNPRNWRLHPKEQQDALRGVLAEVGIVDVLIARELPDGTLELIDGHLRADTLPDAVLPVVVLDVTEKEADKVLATLDPLAGMAETDTAKLDELLARVKTKSQALRAMLDGLKGEGGEAALPEPGQGGDEFDAQAAEEGPCRVARGDLWLVDGGKHRVLCGDSTDAGDVARVMAGERARLCFTSPPYAQQRDYGEAAKEKVRDWDGLMQGVFGNLGQVMTDDGQVLVNLGLVHREGEWWPYWDGWIDWMRGQGWRRFGWYVWDQGFGLPGDWNGRLAPSHEFVWHFNREAIQPEKWVEKKPENIKLRNKGESTMRGKDGKTKPFTNPEASGQPTKVPDSIIRVGRQVGTDGHPAQFPVELPQFVLRTWPGDAFDPFLGSGTTLVAAHRTGRRCFGLEIEPRYCEVVLRRAEAEGLAVQRA